MVPTGVRVACHRRDRQKSDDSRMTEAVTHDHQRLSPEKVRGKE
jgi:hypothetical protein